MQHKNQKTIHFAKIIGKVIREQRLQKKSCSINKFAHEYDLDVGNISRIENGLIDSKIITLWKISEALNIKLSYLIKMIELELGDNFHISEE